MRNFTKLSQECILLTQKIKWTRAIYTEDLNSFDIVVITPFAHVMDYTVEAR